MNTISPNTLPFLKQLSKNNNRNWFNKNKKEFEEARDNFADFIYALADEVAKFDPIVKKELGHNKTVKIFRIYRDVRFAKDKSPYKLNFGGTIAPGGMESGNPGFYLHIQPGANFAGGGIHMPTPKILNNLRNKIAKDDQALRIILNSPSFKKHFKSLYSEGALKTVPRGFDKDHPAADLLRLKEFTGSEKFSDKDVVNKNFFRKVIATYKALKPLNEFLLKASK